MRHLQPNVIANYTTRGFELLRWDGENVILDLPWCEQKVTKEKGWLGDCGKGAKLNESNIALTS
jgi:hypothetical protein